MSSDGGFSDRASSLQLWPGKNLLADGGRRNDSAGELLQSVVGEVEKGTAYLNHVIKVSAILYLLFDCGVTKR
jgi:hypothetical protein